MEPESKQDETTKASMRAAVNEFVNTRTPEETRTVLQKFGKELCTEAAEQLLDNAIEAYQKDEEALNILLHRRMLLQRCRAYGLDQVIAELKKPNPHIANAVLAFLNTNSWAGKRTLLQQQAQDLLIQDADDFCATLLLRYADHPEHAQRIETDRTILAWARESGIEAAFVRVRDALVADLAGAQDPDQRIYLLEEITKLVDPETEPTLFVETTLDLTQSLSRTGPEEHDQNIEQAIGHLESALEVATLKNFADTWLTSIYGNLGLLYYKRSQGDATDNIRKAIAHYEMALEHASPDADRENWAAVQLSLGNALVALEDDATEAHYNRAIQCYHAALSALSREEEPEHWAGVHHMLGNTYLDRQEGGRADNLRAAIEHFQQALQIVTPEEEPDNWIYMKARIGGALRDLDRAEEALVYFRDALETVPPERALDLWTSAGFELATLYLHLSDSRISSATINEAIVLYRELLELMTATDFPQRWAEVQRNLGDAYRRRRQGDRAENLEKALFHTQQALEVWTAEEWPYEWAQIQHNLGSAYYERLEGEKADNIEQSIEHYYHALEIHTQDRYPREWAMTNTAVGMALVSRQRGIRALNVDRAIHHLKLALTFWDRHDDPFHWAECQNALGGAYMARVGGNGSQALDQAILHFENAAAVYTQEAFPDRWMQVHSNLAAAYMETASAEPGTWQKALDHIQRVLEATDREQSPYFWAHSKRNVAAAYANAPPQGARTYSADAIAALREALEVFTLDTYPADHRLTQGYLGHLYFLQRKWQDGLCAYQASMEAGERLLATAYTEIGRRTEVSETSLGYSRAAYCLLELDRPAEALVQLEAGKARLLSEALAMTDADLAMLPDAQQKDMREARRRVRELEAEMRLPPETPARRNDRELAQLLHQTRTRIRDLIHAIRQDHLDFMPTGLDLSGILGLIPKGGALVAPVVTSQGSAIFVLPDGTESIESDHVISLADFTDGDLRELLLGREDDARWDGWMRAYFALFGNRERAPLEGWWAAIEAVTQRVWDQLIAPVHERLQALGLSQDAPVILMPQGGLGLLPLHTAWRTVDGTKRTFLDDYTVSYAPSAYALSVARRRMEDTQRHGASLLAVVNPTGDLRHATGEGRAVAAHFEPGAQTVLVGGEATQAAVVTQARGRCYLHFSCHGFYHWQNPMASGLLLASSDPATVTNAFELREILSPRFDLSAARLVTLSACETGLTEFQQSPDEYIGLPSGFLQAGAPAVVSSLWAVDDLSTALLMGEFYRRHLADGQEPAVALRGAQLWLRAATAEELKLAQRYEELYRASGRRDAEVLRRIRYYRAHPKVVPFAQAYYWAGFIFSGA